ncbi:MAG: CBS domain-containing protein [Nitrospiraceae bacterium]
MLDEKNPLHESDSGLFGESTSEERHGLLEGEHRHIREVMDRNVVTMDPQESLWEAAETFRRLHVQAAPVCARGRLVGLITERDIAVKGVVKPGSPRSIPIRDVMQTEVPACSENDILARAMRLMVEHRVRWLPVLDNAQHVVGLLSADQAAGSISPRAAEALLQDLPPTQ